MNERTSGALPKRNAVRPMDTATVIPAALARMERVPGPAIRIRPTIRSTAVRSVANTTALHERFIAAPEAGGTIGVFAFGKEVM